MIRRRAAPLHCVVGGLLAAASPDYTPPPSTADLVPLAGAGLIEYASLGRCIRDHRSRD